MASEPPEDAIDNFVSFTSTTREQAISFLKVRTAPQLSHRIMTDVFLSQANNLDSQKAINAYFEDPTGPQTKVTTCDARGSECWTGS
jgi:hypothetical protein